MELTSTSFNPYTTIPKNHTGEGEDISPALTWSDISPKCKSLAIVCEDPDAPARRDQDYPYVHWVLYNIRTDVNHLPEGVPQNQWLKDPVGAAQGKNSFGKIGYNGPMPPRGHGTHHYIFTLYALNRELNLPAGLTRDELMDQMQGHILATAKLTGMYERSLSAAAA